MKVADKGISALFPRKKSTRKNSSQELGNQIPKIRVLSQDLVVEQLETFPILTPTSRPKLPIEYYTFIVLIKEFTSTHE